LERKHERTIREDPNPTTSSYKIGGENRELKNSGIKKQSKSLELVESKSNVKARYLGLELNINFFTKSLESNI
jgi:hypothetical protein